MKLVERVADGLRLAHLAARMTAGRRYWIAPLLPLAWLVWCAVYVSAGWREVGNYRAVDVQNGLVAFPLTVLAIGLGVRVIAGEIDRRTLEIAYTVPGGTWRVWTAKLAAAVGILVASEALLAAAAPLFAGGWGAAALVGAFQAAVVYLVLAMALAALFRSEAAGALVTAAVLVLNSMIQGGNPRLSPFWNVLKAAEDAEPAELVAWAVQNRVGFALFVAAVVALAFERAGNRESLLSG